MCDASGDLWRRRRWVPISFMGVGGKGRGGARGLEVSRAHGEFSLGACHSGLASVVVAIHRFRLAAVFAAGPKVLRVLRRIVGVAHVATFRRTRRLVLAPRAERCGPRTCHAQIRGSVHASVVGTAEAAVRVKRMVRVALRACVQPRGVRTRDVVCRVGDEHAVVDLAAIVDVARAAVHVAVHIVFDVAHARDLVCRARAGR